MCIILAIEAPEEAGDVGHGGSKGEAEAEDDAVADSLAKRRWDAVCCHFVRLSRQKRVASSSRDEGKTPGYRGQSEKESR